MDVHNISILAKESNVDEVTDNIVYPEALQGSNRCSDKSPFLVFVLVFSSS
jgi:hypothetical protein